ncbi:MAG: hypothetical protein A3F68_11130 [Acidobacteria bacterium RIFCSPLOWO2_12_FULL_54_10]|nr:MAG: hypothetical protein A3F68_11130 [Acidobacteria bacterium RIFCSPLOWO2_12_FULL_54_10]
MKRLLGFALLAALIPATGQAQEYQPPKAMVHLNYGIGTARAEGEGARIQFLGGGGQGLLYKGFGAGADVGYLFPKESFGEGFGLLSTNGSYHFFTGREEQKVVPFVTAGHSLAFREGTANLFNFGGGVDFWMTQKAALRLEMRDHVWPGGDDCCNPTAHLILFKVGIVGR